MRKIIALSLAVGLLPVVGRLVVRATEPADRPVKGRVLVLENERTLTGDIEQVGEQYRVKRLVGETWVPAAGVLRLCGSLEEAHRVLQGRANLDDPDERLRLAEWCREHGLRRQARDELKAAAQMRPGDARIRRLLDYMEQSLMRDQAPRPAPVAQSTVPPVDVTADSLGMFASKVQPILMNACLRCHTAGRGGRFQLTRVSGSGLTNRRSTEQNLAATLAEVDARQPAASRLLLKAVSLHARGMTQAPLKDRRAPAYRALERWVNLTLENNPHLREQAVASAPPAPGGERFGADREPAPTPAPITPTASATPSAPEKPAPEKAAPGPKPVPASPTPAAKPAGPASSDPVDPEAFNREFHPRPQPGKP
jgi:hypothetical protein